jgi:hypothetical protein
MRYLLALLLCLSLAGNIFFLQQRRAAAPSAASPETATAAKKPDAIPALTAETWALIASGDPSGPDKLRALGLSEYLVRMLVRQQLDRRYQEREQALLAKAGNEYWRYDYFFARWKNADPLKLLDLQREKEAELKSLLGPERTPEQSYDIRYAFLPPEKAEQLRRIDQDYMALSQMDASFDGIVLPEDRERLDYLEKQKRSDLAELLTSEELAAYDLRSSQTSRALRFQLTAFDASEDEFKTLYAIRKAYDEQRGAVASNVFYSTPPGTQKEREALEAEIKTALGDTRYADYKRSQDQDYKILSKLTARLDLPPEKSVEAYNLKTALEEKLKNTRPTPGVDPRQQRAELLATVTKEAEAGFTQILGAKGYEVYKDYGMIFRRLQPQPSPAPKP